MTKLYPSDFWHAELPAVCRRDLNQTQMLCFDTVIEAVQNENQLFLLLIERLGQVSHKLYVGFQPYLVVKMLFRGSFTAKASFYSWIYLTFIVFDTG